MSKKLSLLFCTCFLLTTKLSIAQTPNWLWAEGSGGGNWEYGYGISADSLYNIFIDGRCANTMTLGGLSATAGGGTSPFMEEFDSSGAGKWIAEETYSGGFDYTEGFYRDNKDNTYSTGIINGGLGGMFIDKYNNAGILEWAVIIPNGISGSGVTADNDGNVYVTGIFTSGSYTFGTTTLSYSGSYNAIFLTKLDSDGNFTWAQSIYGTGAADGSDDGRDIITDNNGNIYFCGDYTGSPVFGTVTAPASTGISDFFIAKYDTAGNTQWVTTATNSFAGTFGGSNDLTIDSCGNLYATGGFANTAQFGNLSVTSAGGNDIFVTQCNNNGQWQWVQSAGGTGNDAGFAIALDKNNYVYAAGSFANGSAIFSSMNLSSGNVFVAKYANSNGAIQWVQGATAGGGIHGITIDNSNYVYATGGFRYYAKFGTDSIPATSTENIFIAKLDTVGNRTIAGVFDSVYCPDLYEPLPYTVTGTFNPGNTFTAQLSNSTGSFVSAVTIGSVTSTASGIINVKINNGTPLGSHYHIRIISSNPATSSNVSCNSYISIGKSLQFVLFGDTAICIGSQAKLSVSGGSTYLWSTGDTTATITVAPLKDSTYTVVAGNGICTKDTFVSITVSTPPILTIQPQSHTICKGENIVFTASGSTSYSWSNGDTTSSITLSPAKDTIYNISVSNGICNTDSSVTVTVINVPEPAIQPSSPVICNAGSIELTASGGSSYLWSTGDTTATITVSPVKDSAYLVSVSNGICSKDTFVRVIIDAPPALIIQPQSPTVCNSQSVTLSVNNAESSFAWSPSNGLSSTSSDSTVATPTVTTTYTLICLDSIGCSSSGAVVITVDSCSVVWPGDVNDDSIANNYDLIPIGIYYGDTDTKRYSISNSWLPYLATDWDSIQYDGLNRKYVDCNGDGIINSDDTLAIVLNYGLTHNLPMKGYSPDTIQETVPFYFIADSSSYYPGSPVHISVWLGTSTEQITMLYALGYDIGLNMSLLQSGTLAFNYVNSFTGAKNSDALTLTHLNNDVETAVARIDHHNTNGYGKIGDLYFTLSPSITVAQYIISFTSYEAVDSAGNPIIFQPKDDTLIINQPSSINQLPVNSEQLSVYPNPTSGGITVVSNKNINELKVTNVLGQLIYELQPNQHQLNFELKDDGIYFITIASNNETVTRKILVSK